MVQTQDRLIIGTVFEHHCTSRDELYNIEPTKSLRILGLIYLHKLSLLGFGKFKMIFIIVQIFFINLFSECGFSDQILNGRLFEKTSLDLIFEPADRYERGTAE